MNAYKVEVLIINHDGLTEEQVRQEMECAHYGNDCIRPHIMKIDSRGIGEWADDHPLNRDDTMSKYYKDLFYEGERSKI